MIIRGQRRNIHLDRARRRPGPLVLGALAAVLVLGTVGCSSDDDGDDGAGGGTTTAPANDSGTNGSETGDTDVTGGELGRPAERDRPDEPAAALVGELTAGGAPMLTDLNETDLEGHGFVEHEFAVEGTAVRYVAEDPETDLPANGEFNLAEGDSAPYRTRVAVRRPADAADFNGTVVVEWMNVSGGIDANPDYVYLADEILRSGYAWVGVSVQHIGVEGGPVAVGIEGTDGLAGKGLKVLDPERYGDLDHPGDAYAYDIYTQVSRLIRTGDDEGLLGDLDPEAIIAAGESQSAFALTTYANGVQPLTQEFDAFFIHSRGGAALPLGGPDAGVGIADAIAGTPTIIRTDLEVPSIIVQTESDTLGLLNYLPARQDDGDTIRLWEVAGGAHADKRLVGPLADGLCPVEINDGPTHYVLRAALHHLNTWARGGEAPPIADRFEIDDSSGTPTYVRDDDGIIAGGIRTPAVDVPIRVFSGEVAPDSGVACLLMGSSIDIPADRLAELYPDADTYLSEYQAAVDAAIESGFVLEGDREALEAEANPELFAG
ncbi:MAG: hypothetical protein GX643_00140 [Acidimicrobiales bacterium]|nr:hypothetical protein [Acidimicrobiales bacterium]